MLLNYLIFKKSVHISYHGNKSLLFGILSFTMFSVIDLVGQTLKLGDKAPYIEAYQWINSKPIDEFNDGVVYLIEMGATWCKPCAKSIPEMTKLSIKHKGSLEVISLFVQETNNQDLRNTEKPKYVDNVQRYVDKKGDKIKYTVGVDGPDKLIEEMWIKSYGASNGLPQIFLIDKKGRIAAHHLGANWKEITKSIEELLSDEFLLETSIEKEKKAKEKTSYIHSKDLFVDGNAGNGSNFVHRSILTRYLGDFESGRPLSYIRSHKWIEEVQEIKNDPKQYDKYKKYQGRVQTTNSSLEQLFYIAYADTLNNWALKRHPITREFPDLDSLWWFKTSYGNYWHKPLLEVKNKKPFETKWNSPKNKWNYALNIPANDSIPSAQYLQQLVKEDLQRYFSNYDVALEKRKMPVWYLKSSPDAQKIRSLNQDLKVYKLQSIDENNDQYKARLRYIGADIRDIIDRLATEFNIGYNYSLRNTIESPFIDETGINFLIDFEIMENELQCFENHDFACAKQFLSRLGLYLEKGYKLMKVVVIRDANQKNLK